MSLNTKRLLGAWYDFRYKIIADGIGVGLLSGIIVVLYRFAIEYAHEISVVIYDFQRKHPWMIPLWLLLLVLGGWLVGILVSKEPMISGSGIPQVKGILLMRFKMRWLKVVLYKFIGGAACIVAGLSLGREGPSIQLGAGVGQGFSRMLKKSRVEEKYLITCGASAGLAAAFNAPLAGVVFALEELHKNFSPPVMISALIASISADFISKEFFGLKPVFDFASVKPIPLNSYFYLIPLGILAGAFGVLFNKSITFFQDAYAKPKWLPAKARIIIPFVMAGLLGLVLPQVLGGGHTLVNELVIENPPYQMLLLLIAAKYLFTMVSYGSSAPGGIFLPLLVIGALLGDLYSESLTLLFNVDASYAPSFIILAMAAYFTAIVRAPITGILLITEMTGSFSTLLPVGVVCITAYIAADFIGSGPIYDILLERMARKKDMNDKGESNKKTLLEVVVHMGSRLEGKKIKDIVWPEQCLIVGILRGGKEIIPNGETIILTGDYLVVITPNETAEEVREALSQAAE